MMLRHVLRCIQHLQRVLCDSQVDGYDYDPTGRPMSTPLLRACGTGVTDTVAVLLNCKADMRLRNHCGKGPLSLARGCSMWTAQCPTAV